MLAFKQVHISLGCRLSYQFERWSIVERNFVKPNADLG